MHHGIRRAVVGAPFKLIAVVLLAVLVPSVLVTALGLVEVFEADNFVRESLRQPFDEQLQELGAELEKAWGRRLRAYETYLKGTGDPRAGDRRPYLAQLRERDSAVLDVLLAGPAGLELVGSLVPELLRADPLAPELEELHDLELRRRDLGAALVEARRLLEKDLPDEVQVEVLLAAARLSYQTGASSDALEYLRWTLERYGRTVTELGIVRAVPILLRMAEIESELPSKEALLFRLPQVEKALRDYRRFMPVETVACFDARLAALAPYDAAAPAGEVRGRPEPKRSLVARDLEELAGRLVPPGPQREGPARQCVTVPHSRLGPLDFVGFSDGEQGAWTYLRLDRDDFLLEARVWCERRGVLAGSVHFDERIAGPDDISIVAPAPFEQLRLYFDPPATWAPKGFHALKIIPLTTFTWAVIVSAMTIVVGVAFTLRSVLRELQTARLKTDFVSFVTHELKTPLTAIRMYAETMLEGRVSEESDKRTCVQIIDQESQRLMHLIDQILEYSRLERRQKEFRFVSCDMQEVVDEAVRIFHDHYKDQPRVVEVNQAQHISKIRMDRAAMLELLLNLLSNAAKYSSPDKVIVVNLRESVREISVEVVDHGVGIRKRDHKKIFDRFYRADDYLTREVDGTGLGLAFARYIAKVHNGDIKVASQLGGGSSFTLCLRKTHVLAE